MQVKKICSMFCRLVSGYHYQKFEFHQQQAALAAPFDFTSFSAWLFLVLGHYFLHPGCFWLGCNSISYKYGYKLIANKLDVETHIKPTNRHVYVHPSMLNPTIPLIYKNWLHETPENKAP